MGTPVSGKNNKFDPNSYQVPDYRKDKDGKLDPTTYQAAMGLRNFMHENDLQFIDREQVNNAAKGSFSANGKEIALSDEDKAMFDRLKRQGLFNRLDAGSTNTQDGVIGIKDINDAIAKAWKLHGTETSNSRHWKDPSESDMTKAEGKEVVNAAKDTHGFHYLTRTGIDEIINNQNHRTKNGSTVDADPRLLAALYMVGKDFDAINTDGNHYLDHAELEAWRV